MCVAMKEQHMTCHKCGRYGHFKTECKQEHAKCHKCGKSEDGHMAKDCVSQVKTCKYCGSDTHEQHNCERRRDDKKRNRTTRNDQPVHWQAGTQGPKSFVTVLRNDDDNKKKE